MYMNRFSAPLEKKLRELNGNYNPDFFSIGRLVTMIGNPYGLYPGLSDHNRSEIVDVIRKDLSPESFRVGYNFINTLLFAEYDLNLPNFNDENYFKKVNNYQEYLEDLEKMRKVNLSSVAHHNILQFKNRNGYFKGIDKSPLIMKSWEPPKGDIVRVSFRTKTRESFVEKALERFIRLDKKVIDKTYNIAQNGKSVSGLEIFKEYFSRFKASGLDLYEFHAQQNPQYLRGADLENFKDRFIAIFPIDHDGGKIITRTMEDAHRLVETLFRLNLSSYAGFPIHRRLCENNSKEDCKDRSYTLGIGGMYTFTQSGMAEIKIQDSSAKIESEFGREMHLKYKEEKRAQLRKALLEKNEYVYYYTNLCKAFETAPHLIKIERKRKK